MILRTTCIHCHQILEEVINIAEAIQLKQDKDQGQSKSRHISQKKILSLEWFFSQKCKRVNDLSKYMIYSISTYKVRAVQKKKKHTKLEPSFYDCQKTVCKTEAVI
jgi:hypothetical protein